MKRSSFVLTVLWLAGIGTAAWAYTENDAARLSADFRRSGGVSSEAPVMIDEKALAEKIEQKRDKKISFTLVDLRLEAEYQEGHIPGAVNLPLKKLRFLAEQTLAKADDIIFYGYSRDDQASVNAVILLRNKGFERVALLTGGIDEWKGKKE